MDSDGVLRAFRDSPAVSHPYLERSMRRIELSLAAIGGEVEPYRHLRAIREQWQQRPSLLETAPRFN